MFPAAATPPARRRARRPTSRQATSAATRPPDAAPSHVRPLRLLQARSRIGGKPACACESMDKAEKLKMARLAAASSPTREPDVKGRRPTLTEVSTYLPLQDGLRQAEMEA
ncbi:uncharacterized protein PG986_010512 [Apiospora aurea]|uniref:Uncharacterized protein n=1 Tax=Apiospora aurea TaxID=335848 RepID=A0ABR1Q2G9_9PEZI